MALLDSERIHLSGPNVDLQPSQAMAMSMVIHELATKTVEYGALSNQDGTLKVRWKNTDNQLALQWTERDGPKTHESGRNGFGYVLMECQVEQQLNGKLKTSFTSEGLDLKMEFTL